MENTMPAHSGDTGIEIIFRDECMRLLATEEVGRVAFVNGGQADVLPVNYALDGDTVVFTTAPGSKLGAAGRASVTFEVDRVDPTTRSGWSVVVHGFAHEVTVLDGPGQLEKLRSLPLHPWAGGSRHHLVRITSREVTGRRVGPTIAVAAPAAPDAVALDVLDTEA
jgi:nitroimidazol reductase NimA-like FMN-containing flavoprotein (pyridoxamine 5'-phosphate oxidase superfamily)